MTLLLRNKAIVSTFFMMIATAFTTTSFLLSPSLSSFSSSYPSTSCHSFVERTSSSSQLFMNKKPLQADFEYQELKIQLKAMMQQGVASSQLPLPKKIELEGYVQRILNRRVSPIQLFEIEKFLGASSSNPPSTWELVFTTQSLVQDSLPKDTKIKFEFVNDKELDYILEFTKTWGLKRLVAKSQYTIDSSPVNPGLLTFTYDSITTDVFGLSNIGVGLFGLLKGRSNVIQTAYFDDVLWIEKGFDPVTGDEFVSVYVKKEKEE